MTNSVPDIPMRSDDLGHQWLRDAYSHPVGTRRISFEGANIAVRGWNLEREDLPGLVLAHGFRAHARWWDHVAPLLTGRHRVAALDLSGMGDSDRRPAYSRSQHGREILAVADALGFERPTVVAHSYGGIAALIAARAEPDRFGRAIVVDSAIPTELDIVLHAIPIRRLNIYPTREAALARYVLLPPGRWPDPDVLTYIAWHSVHRVPGGWQWKFDGEAADSLNTDGDYREKLLGQTVPCDFLFGELSELATPERIAQLPLVAPGAGPPVWIPNSHHHIMIEQPLALVAALRTLLSRHPGAEASA